MDNNSLKGISESIIPTEEQKERMFYNIEKHRKGAFNMEEKISSGGVIPMKRIRKRFSMAAVAISICILTTTVALAVTFNWHQMLISYLNPTEQQMQEMGGSLGTPEATITKNGVTITVLQTIADSHGVYVLYEMTAPKEIELNKDVIFRNSFLDLKTDSTATNYVGSGENITLEEHENTRIALYYYGQTAQIGNGYAELQLGDLSQCIYDDNGEYLDLVPLVKGEWNLKWEFNLEDSHSIVFKTNQPVSINGSKNTITEIAVSPLSIYIQVKGDNVLESIRPVVNFKDGSHMAFDVSSNGNSFSYSPMLGNNLYYRFNDIVSPQDVESITIDNVTIAIH